jgi:hypothetical protein
MMNGPAAGVGAHTLQTAVPKTISRRKVMWLGLRRLDYAAWEAFRWHLAPYSSTKTRILNKMQI